MPDDSIDTQAQRMPKGKPESEGLANTPMDTQTGTVKETEGPSERPGTEAEEEAQGHQ